MNKYVTQQRFAEIAKYWQDWQISFVRNIILVENYTVSKSATSASRNPLCDILTEKPLKKLNMKNTLFELYSRRANEFEEIKTKVINGKAYGPFLMSPNLEYSNQNNKLLIIGQETKGWENYKDITKQMGVYEGFNLGINYYSSPFWNVMRKVERALKNKEYSSAWTNISKFDVDRKRPTGENEQIISKLDNLLIEELEITKPKICIFFTSHTFDYRIKRIFSEIEFVSVPGFEKKALCKLKHKDLPNETYRTYHPRYLRTGKMETKFIEFIKTI
jgi:hypothetical protein